MKSRMLGHLPIRLFLINLDGVARALVLVPPPTTIAAERVNTLPVPGRSTEP
ncbi:hypothetical protein ACI2K4_33105 [Micromonospora sp. NPDC050397]|uniref:hypothetical protein n=1 Tax=Micromonospora sp. NPDC050397 TaxID=3364279 RepID=UPI003850356D